MTRRRVGLATTLASAGALLAVTASLATADSFTPVQLTIAVAPVARLHSPLAITVSIAADPGVLDGSEGPLRMEVKLAPECGGTFQTTPGTTLRQRGARAPAGDREVLLGRGQGLGPALRLRRTDGVRVPGGHRHRPGLRQRRVRPGDRLQALHAPRPARMTRRARPWCAPRSRLRHTTRVEVRRRLTRTISARKRTVLQG